MNGAGAIASRPELVNPHAGGMGEVLRVPHLQTGDNVALKLTWCRRTGEEVSLTDADKNAAKFMGEVWGMSRQPEPGVGHRRRH